VSSGIIKARFTPRALSCQMNEPNLQPRSCLGQCYQRRTRSFFAWACSVRKKAKAMLTKVT